MVLRQRPYNYVSGSFTTQLIALYTATCRSLVLLTVPSAMRWLICDSLVVCCVIIELASKVSILISSAATCCVI